MLSSFTGCEQSSIQYWSQMLRRSCEPLAALRHVGTRYSNTLRVSMYDAAQYNPGSSKSGSYG